MPRYDDDDDAFEKDEVAYEAPRKSRAIEDDDDDDDAPVRKPAKAEPAPRKVIRGGWEGVSQLKSSVTDSSYAQRLKIAEEPIIIKFL
jgi:hypothetical protein